MSEHDPHHDGGQKHKGGRGWDGLQPDERIELLYPKQFPVASDSGFSGVGTFETGVYHAPHEIGPFVRPDNNFWYSHRSVVTNRGLLFNPALYTFDRLVAEKAHFPAAFDPHNRHYKDYAPLRLNVAILRNYLANHFFPDGTVPTGDDGVHNETHLGQIALALGESIRHNNSLLNVFDKGFSPKKLNIEGDGAAAMYAKLLHLQSHEDLLGTVKAPYRVVAGKWDRTWRLPPIAETPFDPRNLSAVKPASSDGTPPPPIVTGFGQIGALLAGAATPVFGAVEELVQPVKAEAIRLGRDILEKLKISYGTVPVAQLLDFADPLAARSLFTDVGKVAATFHDHLARAAQNDPAVTQDSEVRVGLNSLGMLAFQAKRFALRNAELRGDTRAAEEIFNQIKAMPEPWKHPANLTVGDLLGGIDRGMARIVSRLKAPVQESDSTGQLGAADEMALGKPAQPAVPVPGLPANQRPNQPTPQANVQQQLQRSQQITAAEQMAVRRPVASAVTGGSAPVTAPASSTRPGKPARGSQQPGQRNPRDALATQMQLQQQQAASAALGSQSMAGLVPPGLKSSLQAPLNAPTSGQLVEVKKAPKLYASKGMQATGSVPAAKHPKAIPVEPAGGVPGTANLPQIDPYAPVPPGGRHGSRIR